MKAYSLPEKVGTGHPPGLIKTLLVREGGEGPLSEAFNAGFTAGFNQQWPTPESLPFQWGDPRLGAWWLGFEAGDRAQRPLCW